MELAKIFEAARDVVQARRVFGDPVERGEVTVIPAATVLGAGGSGGGETPPTAETGESAGTGGGFGYTMIGWPSGAYEISDRGARWVPAFDLNRVLVIALVALALVLRSRRD